MRVSLKLIDHYQQKDPCLKDKYDMGTYHNSCFCGESNINLSVITCEDENAIPSILQIYILNF